MKKGLIFLMGLALVFGLGFGAKKAINAAGEPPIGKRYKVTNVAGEPPIGGTPLVVSMIVRPMGEPPIG